MFLIKSIKDPYDHFNISSTSLSLTQVQELLDSTISVPPLSATFTLTELPHCGTPWWHILTQASPFTLLNETSSLHSGITFSWTLILTTLHFPLHLSMLLMLHYSTSLIKFTTRRHHDGACLTFNILITFHLSLPQYTAHARWCYKVWK